MADKTLTQAAYDTDNIQNQADQVKGQATALKTSFDKTGNDAKIYNNTGLLVELADKTLNNSGSNTIGHNSTSISATNVGDSLEENRLAIAGAVLGQIPDNTLTELKMAAEMKKQAGGVAEFDTVTANKTISDINRIAKLDSGVANAYVITTDGTFSRTDGNILNFIPANNNTGASTINEDTNGVADIKKYVDGAWIALEEGDLKKFQQVQLVWNASESVFQFSPKGGANPMEDWLNPTSNFDGSVGNVPSNIIGTVTGSGWIVGIDALNAALLVDSIYRFGSAVTSQTELVSIVMIRYENGFTIRSQSTLSTTVMYVEGDVFEEAIPKVLTDENTGISDDLLVNVTGEGWYYGGYFKDRATKTTVDSVVLTSGHDVKYFNAMFKFNTALKIECEDATGVYATYTLLP